MANGGMYDQLGGGFHRYSTDAKWLVPHFEKMLYDNALLSRLYLHYFQVSHEPSARETVEGILDYVLREMTDPCRRFLFNSGCRLGRSRRKVFCLGHRRDSKHA